eukprot:2910224-Rhodomonas_salina.1
MSDIRHRFVKHFGVLVDPPTGDALLITPPAPLAECPNPPEQLVGCPTRHDIAGLMSGSSGLEITPDADVASVMQTV